MDDAPHPDPSRRSLLVAGGAVVSAALLGACDGSRAAATGATGATGGSASVVMLVRHAEKPTGDGAPYGVTDAGEQDAESLTVRGWTRAGALVDLFAPADGGSPPRPGLMRPQRVVAADPSYGSRRPAQTATPLARRLGLDLVTTWAKGQEAALAADLRGRTGVTLVAWEHERIPAIVTGLGTVTPAPPSSWPGDRFDLVWVLVRDGAGGGWTFTQVLQELLAGDAS